MKIIDLSCKKKRLDPQNYQEQGFDEETDLSKLTDIDLIRKDLDFMKVLHKEILASRGSDLIGCNIRYGITSATYFKLLACMADNSKILIIDPDPRLPDREVSKYILDADILHRESVTHSFRVGLLRKSDLYVKGKYVELAHKLIPILRMNGHI